MCDYCGSTGCIHCGQECMLEDAHVSMPSEHTQSYQVSPTTRVVQVFVDGKIVDEYEEEA